MHDGMKHMQQTIFVIVTKLILQYTKSAGLLIIYIYIYVTLHPRGGLVDIDYECVA